MEGIIEIPEQGDEVHDMWALLMQLHEESVADWTLIGAQMVQLHGHRLKRAPTRPSRDADLLIECRVLAGPRLVAEWLGRRGFELDGMSPDHVGHRFTDGRLYVDLLAPDHLGEKADLTTVPPARTLAVPGGRRAMNARVAFSVKSREAEGRVWMPNLAGALVAKARAVTVDDLPEAQRMDLAFLLGLASLELEDVAVRLDSRDRGYLSGRREFLELDREFWVAAGELADDARIAYRRLID